jgi:DNA-binding NarL/FixJ family response regulator
VKNLPAYPSTVRQRRSRIARSAFSRSWYSQISAWYEIEAAVLSVVIVKPLSPDQPGSDLVTGRPVALDAVDPCDDVVIILGPGGGRRTQELRRRMGPSMPGVLVIAPALDPDDICLAFRGGATSYGIEGSRLMCLSEAIVKTAAGISCVDPQIANLLAERVAAAAMPPGLPIHPGDGGDVAAATALTPRERQIMELIAAGYRATEAASRLLLSERTVRNNLTNIYAKLKVRRQSEAVMLWLGRRPTAFSRS